MAHIKARDIVQKSMAGRDLGEVAPEPVQEAPPDRVKGRRNRETVPATTRLEPAKRDALEAHFRAIGLDLSSGIRSVLYEYMRENRVR